MSLGHHTSLGRNTLWRVIRPPTNMARNTQCGGLFGPQDTTARNTECHRAIPQVQVGTQSVKDHPPSHKFGQEYTRAGRPQDLALWQGSAGICVWQKTFEQQKLIATCSLLQLPTSCNLRLGPTYGWHSPLSLWHNSSAINFTFHFLILKYSFIP